MSLKFFALAAGAILSWHCQLASPAFADGMPFQQTKPEPILTPLEATSKEPPTDLKPAAVQELPTAPAAELPPLKTDMPPLPEARVVEAQPDPSFFGLSIGMHDSFTHSKGAPSFSVEWQPGVRIAGFLQPLFGAMATTRGSLLGYGGIGLPLRMNEHVKLLPSLAVGAYGKGGGFDLGQTMVFRAGTELAYQFDDKSRIGLNVHVLTNGSSTGRRDRTEVVGLAYTVPIKPFSKAVEQAAPPTLAAPAMSPPPADMITFQ